MRIGMRNRLLSVAAGGSTLAFLPLAAAAPLMSPGDFIIAVDTDVSHDSDEAEWEPASWAIDGNYTNKYFNFGGAQTGLMVTTLNGEAGLSPTVKSMRFHTANDFEDRDPSAWSLWGSSDIFSFEQMETLKDSDSTAASWTLISEGTVDLPTTRFTPGPLLTFSNATAYPTYRIVFENVRGNDPGSDMQIAEVELFEAADGTGSNVLSFGNVAAIALPVSESASPGAEGPVNAIDGSATTKLLNFGKQNSGLIMTPGGGAKAVTSFQITTANDWIGRDPASWILYGTNAPISSENNSAGLEENWVLIDSGDFSGANALPGDVALDADPMEGDPEGYYDDAAAFGRLQLGPMISVDNTTAYSSYKILFPTLKNETPTDQAIYINSMQIAEIQLFDSAVGANDADFNNDNIVDGTDFLLWQRGGINADANHDGVVNGADLTVWKQQYGTAGGGSIGAVPEPAAATLGAIGCCVAALSRVRGRGKQPRQSKAC